MVSVVLPVRNGAEFLEEAARSILGQTFRRWELLAVDDGSTDETAEILSKLAKEDGRVRVLRQEAEGLVAALNRGVAAARGEFVARMDADDISEPERLGRQIDFFGRNPDVGVCGTWAREFGPGAAGLAGSPCDNDLIRAWLLFGSPFVHPTVMAQRALLASEPGPYASLIGVEDYELWVRLAKSTRFANLPEPLLRYRRHAAQYTAAKAARHAADLAGVHARVLSQIGVDLDAATDRAAHAAAAFDRDPAAVQPRPAELAAWLRLLRKRATGADWCGRSAIRRMCGDRWWAFMRGRCGGVGEALVYLRGPTGGFGARVGWRACRLARDRRKTLV